MSNPNPLTDHLKPYQIKPGEVRNPQGYSRGRRLSDRLEKFIDEHGLTDTVARVWLGAAIDQPALLDTTEDVDEKDKDGKPVTKKHRYRRRPNAAFFSMMLDRLEGKVKDAPEEPDVRPGMIEEAHERRRQGDAGPVADREP